MPLPIACELFDYIEIACMYSYRIRVSVENGKELIGVARTTQIKHKVEYLVLATTEQKGELNYINTAEITHISVLSENTKFKDISFR